MYRLYHTTDHHVAPQTYTSLAEATNAACEANRLYGAHVWGVASTLASAGKTDKLTPELSYRRDRLEQRWWEKRMRISR